MDRVFLDANVLFSAAYRPDAGLVRLWNLKNVRLISSSYAIKEAITNLETKEQQERLKILLNAVEIIDPVKAPLLPLQMDLPEKDRPILQAAIASKATHLLTGDIRHFGEWFGKTIETVTVLLPAVYLHEKSNRSSP